MTRIGRLDCATLVLDGYLPVHPGPLGVTPSAVALVLELRAGRAAAACAGGAFAGAITSTVVSMRCVLGHAAGHAPVSRREAGDVRSDIAHVPAGCGRTGDHSAHMRTNPRRMPALVARLPALCASTVVAAQCVFATSL